MVKTRNLVVGTLVVALVVIGIWFIGFGGANPFKDYLNVKITAGVECTPLIKYCWYNRHMNMEYSTERMSVVRPLVSVCAYGAEVETFLKVENPDSTYTEWKTTRESCVDADPEIMFKVPLDKGIGMYQLEAQVCGKDFFGTFKCDSKTETFVYGG